MPRAPMQRASGESNMFKYLLISIVIVPILLGAKVANARGGQGGVAVLITGWALYGILWFGMLYFLRHRWVG